MNAYKANLLNSLSLIFIGFGGYFESSSITALIPVVWLCTVACSKELKIKQNNCSYCCTVYTNYFACTSWYEIAKVNWLRWYWSCKSACNDFNISVSNDLFCKSFIEARRNKS